MLFSCTAEENETIGPRPADMHLRIMDGYPENKSNAFDIAGKLHNSLCLAFEAAPAPIASVSDAVGVTDVLCASDSDFLQLTSGGYTPPSAARLEFILGASQNAQQVIDQSSLSLKAKISLTNFLSTLDFYKSQGKEYDTVYQFIIEYEDSVLHDPVFSSTDRQILFTTSSIARYAHHFASLRKKKPPRDKDWDASIGNIAAGTDGSQESTAKAVAMSVAASLYTNR